MTDIQLCFEHYVTTKNKSMDLAKDGAGAYLVKKTAKAFDFFKAGFLDGQKG